MRLSSIVVLLLGSFIFTAFSQQPIVLSLDESVKLALEKNINVIESQNNVDASRSGYLAAIGSYLPTLSASAGWGRDQIETPKGLALTPSGYRWVNVNGTDSIYGPTSLRLIETGGKDLSTSYSAGLNVNYTLFDGFRREANLNRASSNVKSSEQTAVRTRQLIRYTIESAYLNVLKQEQIVKVSEENLKKDRQQLDRITESNRVGALSLADVYRQQSQVAADEFQVISDQNTYDKTVAALIASIGLDMGVEYQFKDQSISTNIDQAELNSSREKYKDLNDLIKRALTARPDYLAAKESYDASESGVTSAKAGYFPRISASAGYNLSSSEFSALGDRKNINWGINLSWNIFDAFQTNQSVQSAVVSKKNSEYSLTQLERDIAVEIRKALLDLESASKQVEVGQKGVQSATEDRKIAEERYNLGAGTLLDLLTANLGYVQAATNEINAAFSYITAKRNLEYVIGERSN